MVSMKRVCLLTGSSGKLGTAFCKAHAKDYEIAAVYKERPPAVVSQWQHLVDPLGKTNAPENADPVFAIQADLTRDSELTRVVELTLARFNRIDSVIYAAACTTTGPILRGDKLLNSAESQFRLNVIVPLKLAAIVAREFWEYDDVSNRTSNRCWINLSSTSATNVYKNSGQSVYGASKAAINILTLHMANEFQSMGVRVNALAPNSFPRLIPISQVVAGLRQLDTGNMTGQILVLDKTTVDGG
jgi:NAD(P)-dependent dehydrogenase (short-subunit alcohol dehydrogenase family)